MNKYKNMYTHAYVYIYMCVCDIHIKNIYIYTSFIKIVLAVLVVIH